MAEITKDINLNQVAILLSRYQFEMKDNNIQVLLEQWLPLYPVRWIRLAVVEALYQGRYKVISVEHILNLWLRRGHPTFHFNHEFERMICHNMLGSMVVANYNDIAQRRLSQTALPSFYQMEQSATFSSFNSPIEINLENETKEVSKVLPSSEAKDNNLINIEDDSEVFLTESEPTFIKNVQFDSSATQLTDVKKLLAQLMSKKHLSELTIMPEKVNEKIEQQILTGQSIDEFNPDLNDSALYSKLKSVFQKSL